MSICFYHGVRVPKVKSKLRIIDHLNIYFLIAGTYPISIIKIYGKLGWTIFGIMWGLTVLGVIYKIFFFGFMGFIYFIY